MDQQENAPRPEPLPEAQDTGKVLLQIPLKNSMLLIISPDRITIHKVKMKKENYHSTQLLYWHLLDGNITREEIDSYEVHSVNSRSLRVLLVLNGIAIVFLITLSASGLQKCTLVSKIALTSQGKRERNNVTVSPDQSFLNYSRGSQQNGTLDTVYDEKIYDAKIFRDLDIIYTKRYKTPELVPQDLPRINQYLFIQRINGTPLNGYKLPVQPEDRPIFTQNCSDEAMKIAFCASYLNLLLYTKNNVQILFMSIFYNEVLKSEIIDKIAKQSVPRNLKDIKANLVEEHRLEELMMEDDIGVEEKDARKLDWRQRYSEILTLDMRLQKFRTRMISKIEYASTFANFSVAKSISALDSPTNRSEVTSRRGLVPAPREAPLNEEWRSNPGNTIEELVTSNLHEHDRLVFIAERGYNPGLILMGCYRSGLRFFENYTFSELFKLESHKINCKYNERTFKNLRVKLEHVYESSKDLFIVKERTRKRRTLLPQDGDVEYSDFEDTDHYQSSIPFSRERNPYKGPADEFSKLFKIIVYQKSVIYDYSIVMYCPEEEALITLNIRVQEDFYFTPKYMTKEKVSSMRNLPNKYEKLGYLKQSHRVLEARYEILFTFKKEAGVLPISTTAIRPHDTILTNLQVINIEEAPFRHFTYPTTMKPPEPEDAHQHQILSFHLPNLSNFSCSLFYIDDSWLTRRITMFKDNRLDKICINYTVDEKDKEFIEEINEIIERRSFKERMEKERLERLERANLRRSARRGNLTGSATLGSEGRSSLASVDLHQSFDRGEVRARQERGTRDRSAIVDSRRQRVFQRDNEVSFMDNTVAQNYAPRTHSVAPKKSPDPRNFSPPIFDRPPHESRDVKSNIKRQQFTQVMEDDDNDGPIFITSKSKDSGYIDDAPSFFDPGPEKGPLSFDQVPHPPTQLKIPQPRNSAAATLSSKTPNNPHTFVKKAPDYNNQLTMNRNYNGNSESNYDRNYGKNSDRNNFANSERNFVGNSERNNGGNVGGKYGGRNYDGEFEGNYNRNYNRDLDRNGDRNYNRNHNNEKGNHGKYHDYEDNYGSYRGGAGGRQHREGNSGRGGGGGAFRGGYNSYREEPTFHKQPAQQPPQHHLRNTERGSQSGRGRPAHGIVQEERRRPERERSASPTPKPSPQEIEKIVDPNTNKLIKEYEIGEKVCKLEEIRKRSKSPSYFRRKGNQNGLARDEQKESNDSFDSLDEDFIEYKNSKRPRVLYQKIDTYVHCYRRNQSEQARLRNLQKFNRNNARFNQEDRFQSRFDLIVRGRRRK